MVERGGGVTACIVVGTQGAVLEDRVGGGEGYHGKHARVMFRVEVYYKTGKKRIRGKYRNGIDCEWCRGSDGGIGLEASLSRAENGDVDNVKYKIQSITS